MYCWSRLNPCPTIFTSFRNVSHFLLRTQYTIATNSSESGSSDTSNVGEEIITNLKKKFSEPGTSRNTQVQILTLAPASWNERKVANQFKTTRHLVKTARKLCEEKGILATPKSKQHCTRLIPSSVNEAVLSFYRDDENSRLLPGIKDCVSVKQADGSRKLIQKRLILCNLKELYCNFKTSNTDMNIGFSKFASLRPKECVVVGGAGTHTVCVCTIHQNVKLMLEAFGLHKLAKPDELQLQTFIDCMSLITCETPKEKCYLYECELCPPTVILVDHLNKIAIANDIEEVEFKSWQTTDRATLKTEIMPINDFIDDLVQKLKKLKSHHFIAKQQSAFLRETKSSLSEGEFVVSCDFAENYAFVIQESAQAFHWNNNQATVHPVVIYYKTNDEELKHDSMVFISDILHHDTVLFYIIQKSIISYLKSKYDPKRIIYFTDGAPQHYKNKFNFINLLHHKSDFGIAAEFHFHATAHGKGPCDGIGGNVKRAAARASLQGQMILTAVDLFNFTEKKFKELNTVFLDQQNYNETKEFLKTRFESAKTIPGTLTYHAFVPVNNCKQLKLKKNSSSDNYVLFPKKIK